MLKGVECWSGAGNNKIFLECDTELKNEISIDFIVRCNR